LHAGVLKSNGFNGLYPDNEYATRLFERLFGPSGEIFGGHSSPSMRRGRDVQHVLQLSLEELYSGKTSKLALQKSVLCSKCNGVGGPEVSLGCHRMDMANARQGSYSCSKLMA
jgi:DnaJ family protein A protein 2